MKIFAFILGIPILGLAGAQKFEQVKINKPALDFSLKTIQGDEVKLSEIYNGQPVVLVVYPGPSDELQKHAEEFSEDFMFPENFYFVLDPDCSIINKYGLRWDAPKETAYPSTFIISKEGKIVFSKVSTTHGGRATNEEIFEALGDLNSAK